MESLRYNYKVLLGLILLPLCTFASDDSHLHQLNHNISNVKKIITDSKSQQHKQQLALKQLEIDSADIALKMRSNTQAIRKINLKINKLKIKAATYQSQITQERQRLATNIKTIYMTGKPSNLELALEQNDPAEIERSLTYYQYLNKQHINEITQLQNTLKLAQQTLTDLQQNYQQLSQLRLQERHQLARIQSLKLKRNQLINRIKDTIHGASRKLQILLGDKQRLEQEVASLNANSPYYAAIGKPFSKLRHHLNWPTKGKLIAKYGTKIDESQLRWKGVLFNAHQDQPVYAVADGKVIFARWLQGYGLLIIVYHGQGYMTLYGRNHYLYKKTGDIVHAGDQIAAVGDSGGHQHPSLYFAIRHNTLPLNPTGWFKHS